MSSLLTLLRLVLVFVHRWLGVALSAILTLWFASGVVMLYRGFPEVTLLDRLARMPTLESDRIRLTAEEAFDTGDGRALPANAILTTFDGRPVYIGGGRMVYADDGSEQLKIDEGMIDRAAAAWSGRPVREATKTSVVEADQWTVSASLRAMRPMYRYVWPDGQHVYVNGNTADVVQYTTTASRFWAHLGAIPHWLYYTPLRTQRGWYPLVTYSSFIGTVTIIIGIGIAVWMYSPRRRYRHAGAPASLPYHGWKRWHAVLGLVFGGFAATWAFSGWLSMGPFPIMERLAALTASNRDDGRDAVEIDLSRALRGRRAAFAAYEAKSPAAAVASVAPGFDVKELDYTSFDDAPMYLVVNGRGETRMIPVDGEPMVSLDPEDLMERIRAGAGGHLADLRLMHEYDAYYIDRKRQRPLPVIAMRLDDAMRSRYYIDPATATVVGSYSSREWVSRWLYRGLHSLDFPWLYRYRPLWDVVVITLLVGGTILCVSSLVLTVRVLARTLLPARRTYIAPTTVDLPSSREST